jgi:transcriptional regulator with XRE-family HTH domain
VADLPQALDAALRARYRVTEVRTPITQRRGLTARMNQLEKHHAKKGDRPGQAAARAARAAGISPETWRRWRKGDQPPSARMLAKLQDAYTNTLTLPSLRRSLKAAGLPKEVHVTAVVRWNGYYNQGGIPPGHRTIKFGPGGIPGVMRSTIRAWAYDGPEAAALAFEYALSELHNVPDETGYDETQPDQTSPGIRFEGNDVEINFL